MTLARTGRGRRLVRRVGDLRDAALDRLGRPANRYRPVDHDRAEGFRDRFPASARAARAFLRRARHVENGTGPGVAVVVMPWFGSPAPWFAIAAGLGLARRGRRVTFVLHDLPVDEEPAFLATELADIDAALDLVRDRFDVLRASEVDGVAPPGPTDAAVVGDLAAQILVWRTRAATPPTPSEVARSERTRTLLAEALPRVRAVLAGLDVDYLVVPGGVLVASGLYLQAARERGVRPTTFDAGLGWSVVCTDGVAAQQTDVTRAVRMLEAEAGDARDRIVADARAAFAERRAGTDAMAYQVTDATGPGTESDGLILVPLSVMFDTAALGRSHLYADAGEWLAETVRLLVAETSDPIVVRQHPSERHAGERSRFDPAAVVATALGPDHPVEVVLAEDDRNTYDLLDAARLVIPFVSTIGIEAAALGHAVVLGGDAYYGDLGFAWTSTDRAGYEDVVRRGARGELGAALPDSDRAWLCYYLNAVTARTWTDFTSQPADFWRWVVRDPDELLAEPAVDDLFTALDTDVPLCLVRHRRRVAEGAI